ncbi:MAG: site-2 protease family protein [Actinomycetota bacterium]|nr:site-2 protease family protein [Actinomycetota bacterium]
MSLDWFPTSWVLAFAGFVLLIILHEFGHFIAAKRTGMRVERFFLFFPPKVVSVKRGETEYGVGAIPAGGFVKITGMNPDEELPPEVAERGYYHQPVWKRIVVIGAGPAMNLLIAFLILFVLAFGIKEAVGPGLEVGEVLDGSPAQGVLQDGDRVVSIDGVALADRKYDERADAFRERIGTHACSGEQTEGCAAAEPVNVVVERDGEEVPLAISPEYDPAAEQVLLGVGFQAADVQPLDPSVPEAAREAVDQMWFVTTGTFRVLSRIFDAEERKQISGVVGSYETTRQAVDLDTRTALLVLAVISLSLAIINLFPFLPLDGGHIFWSLVEKVRGRPVAFATMERAGALGFVLILFLFFIGLSNDIDRLTGEGFNLREEP